MRYEPLARRERVHEAPCLFTKFSYHGTATRMLATCYYTRSPYCCCVATIVHTGDQLPDPRLVSRALISREARVSHFAPRETTNSYSHQIGRHYDSTRLYWQHFLLSKGSERRGGAPRFNFQTSNGSQCRGRELSRNPR